MRIKTNCLQDYQDVFIKNGIELLLLDKDSQSIERLSKVIVGIDSKLLFPTDNAEKLYGYAEKLIDNGYNFVLVDGNDDIGILSIYANDFSTKTAFTSTIGIIPSHRGGATIHHLVQFALDFAREKGMERYRAEVHKVNERWVNFLTKKFGFQIENETRNETYMIIKDL